MKTRLQWLVKMKFFFYRIMENYNEATIQSHLQLRQDMIVLFEYYGNFAVLGF